MNLKLFISFNKLFKFINLITHIYSTNINKLLSYLFYASFVYFILEKKLFKITFSIKKHFLTK